MTSIPLADVGEASRLTRGQSSNSTPDGELTMLADDLDPDTSGWNGLEVAAAGSFADVPYPPSFLEGCGLGAVHMLSTFGMNIAEPVPSQIVPSEPSTGLVEERVADSLLRGPDPEPVENLWPHINVFLDRLLPSMPFFTRSYLVSNIKTRRHERDHAFNALIYAISALALLQPLLTMGQSLLPNRAKLAERLLDHASKQHSHVDLGEAPVLEDVLTSVFLFGCQFCRNNHNAARFRLKEAVTLGEILGLDNPQTYGDISLDERDRRLRTLLYLTFIQR